VQIVRCACGIRQFGRRAGDVFARNARQNVHCLGSIKSRAQSVNDQPEPGVTDVSILSGKVKVVTEGPQTV